MRIGWKQMTVVPALAAAMMIAAAPTASAVAASGQQVAVSAPADMHGVIAHGWCPWRGHWCPGPAWGE
jgi:hypothetical protein